MKIDCLQELEMMYILINFKQQDHYTLKAVFNGFNNQAENFCGMSLMWFNLSIGIFYHLFRIYNCLGLFIAADFQIDVEYFHFGEFENQIIIKFYLFDFWEEDYKWIMNFWILNFLYCFIFSLKAI